MLQVRHLQGLLQVSAPILSLKRDQMDKHPMGREPVSAVGTVLYRGSVFAGCLSGPVAPDLRPSAKPCITS